MEFQEESRLFEYDEIEKWFSDGKNTGFPWSLKDARKGKERIEEKIQDEIKALRYLHSYEPFDPEIHALSFCNLNNFFKISKQKLVSSISLGKNSDIYMVKFFFVLS